MPGGNLGNVSALGKAFIELRNLNLISRLPRIAVVQARGAAPFYDFFQAAPHGVFEPVPSPETLATAIRIGNPVSWPKAQAVLQATEGVVEVATEQEIADAKAIIGRCGIGCEPASAATLAGIRRLVSANIIRKDDRVVAVLTGNLMKDSDYVYRYHTRTLKAPDGANISSTFGNAPLVVENSASKVIRLLESV
jgi:threonine synthase